MCIDAAPGNRYLGITHCNSTIQNTFVMSKLMRLPTSSVRVCVLQIYLHCKSSGFESNYFSVSNDNFMDMPSI